MPYFTQAAGAAGGLESPQPDNTSIASGGSIGNQTVGTQLDENGQPLSEDQIAKNKQLASIQDAMQSTDDPMMAAVLGLVTALVQSGALTQDSTLQSHGDVAQTTGQPNAPLDGVAANTREQAENPELQRS